MPAAAVTAAAAVGGALISSGASKNAQKAQARATGAALGYEQQKEREAKDERAAGIADYQKRYDDWVKGRNAILAKYGVTLPGAEGAPATGGAGGSRITRAFDSTKDVLGSAAGVPAGPAQLGQQAPMTLGSLMGTTPAFGGAQVAGGPAAAPMAMDPQGMAPPPVPGPAGPGGPGQTLADLGNWGQWDQYLNKGRT